VRTATPCNPEETSLSLLSRLGVLFVVFTGEIRILSRALIRKCLRDSRSVRNLKRRLVTSRSTDTDPKFSLDQRSEDPPTTCLDFSLNPNAPDHTDEPIQRSEFADPNPLPTCPAPDQPLRMKSRKRAKRPRSAELAAPMFIQVSQGRYIRVEGAGEDAVDKGGEANSERICDLPSEAGINGSASEGSQDESIDGEGSQQADARGQDSASSCDRSSL
jgi:hypothetical protein